MTDEELIGELECEVQDMTIGTGNTDDAVILHLAREDADRLQPALKHLGTVEGCYWVRPGTAEIVITREIPKDLS